MDIKNEYSVGNMAPVVQPDQILSKTGEYEYVDDAFDALDLGFPNTEETDDSEDITEGAVEKATLAILAGSVVYCVGKSLIDRHKLKFIEKYYKTHYDDFVQFDTKNFDVKHYKYKPSGTNDLSDAKGKEKKDNFIGRLRATIHEYSHNGTVAFLYTAIRKQHGTVQETRIRWKMNKSSKLVKYEMYYLAKICAKESYGLDEVNKWISKEYKRLKKGDSSNVNESVDFVTESKKIDDDMLPITKALEAKGYDVKYSCSGHPSARAENDVKRDGVRYSKLYTTARIIFAKKYDIGSAPKGWIKKSLNTDDDKYENDCTALYVDEKSFNIADGTPKNAFYKWKSSYMDSLKSWVDELPVAGKEETTKESVDVTLDTLLDDMMTDML